MGADLRGVAQPAEVPGSPPASRARRSARWLAAAAAALLCALALPVLAEQVDYSSFDHTATGFPLRGRHLNLKCEQCHLSGVFEGTPRECKICHIQGNPRSAMYVPSNHVPLESSAFRSSDCTDCHTDISFGGAHFAHANVTPGQCSVCHNGVNAQGKSKNHIPTNQSCDACHLTISFATAFEAYPPGHIPTSQPCQTCHSAGFNLNTTQMVHTGISTGCTTCHAADAPKACPPPPLTFTMTLGTASGQPITLTPTSQMCPGGIATIPHITTGISCESCHAIPSSPMPPLATPGLFQGGQMNHTGISGGCASCHADGKGPFRGVPGSAVPALVTQNTPHTPHIPTSIDCGQCHKSTTVPGGFAGTAMNHTGIASNCNSCHENNAADIAYYGVTTKMVVRPPTSGAAPDPVTPVDANHPQDLSQDCSQCHSSTANFNTGIAKPGNHIPSGTTACTNCHLGSAAPYAPANTTMNHTGFTASCAGCHGPGLSFYGSAETEAGGQPLQPPGSTGNPQSLPHIPYGSTDCVSCHSGSSTSAGGFKTTMSSGDHQAVASMTCTSCHNFGQASAWYGVTTTVVPGGTSGGAAGSGQHIALGKGDCITCHTNASPSFATGGFKITATPALGSAGHAAVSSVTCATCHGSSVAGVGWQGLATPSPMVTALSTHLPFANASCSGCHGSNFVTNGFHISGTPGTGTPVMSVASHAVALGALGNTCDQCHDGVATPAALSFQGVGNQIYLRPGSAAMGLSPNDAGHTAGHVNGDGISLATGDCVNCHTTTPPFAATANGLPGNHIPLTGTTGCATNCHKNGYSAATTQIVHTDPLVSGETCTSCHGSGTGPFYGTGPGSGGEPFPIPGTVGSPGASNHMPVGSADCKSCHKTVDGTISAFTTTGAGFVVSGQSPLLNAAGHGAVSSVSCASCHGTAVDSGGGFKGLTARTTLQVAEASGTLHIPTGSAACSACHGSNFVTGGFVLPNKGTTGSGPATSVMSTANHAIATAALGNTCNQCHDGVVTPAATTFQGVGGSIMLRPSSAAPGTSPADAAHAIGTLASPNDCVNCHNTSVTFAQSAANKPSNHIPLASSTTCAALCHAAGYTATTTSMNHTDSSVSGETCTSCHGASVYSTWYGSGVGSGGQPVPPPGTVGTPGANNHIPVGSADCKACHTKAPTNGLVSSMTGTLTSSTGFQIAASPNVMPAASHTAVVSSVACATCHYLAGTPGNVAWKGVSVKAPPGTPAAFPCSGAACNPSTSNHIPIPSEVCTTCHASTGYTTFTGTAMNHAGITSGCAGCHATGSTFYGVTMVTQLSAHIVFNSGTDCVTCHGQNFATGGFKISTAPVLSTANHSYVSTTCTNCHENNALDLTFQGVLTGIYVRPGAAAAGLSPADLNHAAAVSGLVTGATGQCSVCHSTTPPFTGGTEPSNHIPTGTGASCAANCHKGGFTPATTVMDHADPSVSGTTCVTCHGKGKGPFYGTAQSQAGGQPMQPPGTVGVSGATNHIPMGPNGATTNSNCNTGCHTAAPPTTAVSGGFSFAMKGNSAAHGIVVSGADCDYCHESGLAWYLDATGGKIRTRPSGHHTGTDCGSPNGCHAGQYNGFGGAAAAAAAAKAKAAISLPKRIPAPTAGGTTAPGTTGSGAKLAGTGPYSHLGVAPGSCLTCHSVAGGATALPSGHLPTTLSCNACHRTFAWSPVSYAHAGVGPSACATCHAGPPTWATPKPAGHFVTNRTCSVCHHTTTSWLPVMYDHLTPRYRPQPGILACRDCHTTNTEQVVPGASKAGARRALPGGAIRTR
jgi:hypothetical protein